MVNCNRCNSNFVVKSGLMNKKQRYKCKSCKYFFTLGDGRSKWDLPTKSLAVRMYLNNCGFRRISEILSVPLATVFSWIEKAGYIVDEIVASKKEEVESIEILEMDELFTYVKKNLKRTKKPKSSVTHIPEYGLLWIGIDLKLLRLR